MPAKLQISLSNLKSNIKNIQSYVKEKSLNNAAQILAMVKADAYSAGIVEVSKVLGKLNIKYLGNICMNMTMIEVT